MKINRRRFLLTLISSALCVSPLFAAGDDFVLLAQEYRAGTDPRGFLVSEKLDGVRAIWDGKLLRFRSGRAIAAPASFLAKLPPSPLDGELWLARGQFDLLSGIVRKSVPDEAQWAQVKFMVFELPAGEGSFRERSAALKRIVATAGNAQLQWIEQFSVANESSLRRKLDEVVAQGGEGLVLHRTEAPYITGRSDALLKLKPLFDSEAVVIGHTAGKGRQQGKVGALQMRTPEGETFRLGTGLTDAIRANPPPVGSVVTYQYRDKTSSGKPRFASYLRLRAEE
jgi:DNA ligase 1